MIPFRESVLCLNSRTFLSIRVGNTAYENVVAGVNVHPGGFDWYMVVRVCPRFRYSIPVICSTMLFFALKKKVLMYEI